jgi:thiamine phosphate synthase YjbQ (UPF0047 family)
VAPYQFLLVNMVGTPLDVLPYVRGIQMVLSGYEGYTKGKRRNADLAIREEIKRCGTRARNHIMNIHDSSFREKKIDVAKAAKACCNTIDQLIEDIDKSPTGMTHAFFSGQRSASVSVLKKLIKHDHDVIEMMTKAVNISNSVEHAFSSDQSDNEVKSLIRKCEQMITSSRGYYSVRSTVLDGLRQKKKV